MADLGVAVAGTGFMGPTHAEALRRLGIRVVGVLGSSAEKSRRAADAMGLEKAYGSFDEILKDDAVTAVHITTPNKLHYQMAKAALEAGKHVLCEKPLAMTSAESGELVEVAKRSGRAAGVNYNIRFYPLNLEARERVRGGEIGDVLTVQGSYVQDWLLFPTDYNWRVLDTEGGKLRAIADIGTHWLDLVQAITGLDVAEVFADLHTVHPTRQRPKGEVQTFAGPLGAAGETEEIKIETEDVGGVMLRFTNGARGSLWVSQTTAGRKNRLSYEIAGSQASLAWVSETPNEIWVGRRDRANEVLLKDPGLLSEPVRPFTNYPGGHNEGFPDTFKQCFRAFYDYIQAGDMAATPRFPTFADGHKEIRLCEAILRSHDEGRWVRL